MEERHLSGTNLADPFQLQTHKDRQTIESAWRAILDLHDTVARSRRLVEGTRNDISKIDRWAVRQI
jgi:hypothetical protein